MERLIYWLWLTNERKVPDNDIMALIMRYKTIENVYAVKDVNELKGFSKNTVETVMNKSLEKAYEVKNKIDSMGGYILTIDDEEYPSILREIYLPPFVLYCLGQRLDWDKLLTITIVGTRLYDDYGRKVTEKITRELSDAGTVIVSGMARGIDSIAGTTAIMSGGRTVAVLGSGVDVIYPPEHIELYNEICRNGCIISEYPPGTRPDRWNFPRRNRIMAGLSYGVIVTQAPKKSGALITADYALEYGRDVYAVPASIFNRTSEGSNELLKQGAKAVQSGDDVISEYPYITSISETKTAPDVKKQRSKEVDTSSLNELQVNIVKLLADKPWHVDELCRELNVESYELNSEMVMLEIDGIVHKLNGNIYELS